MLRRHKGRKRLTSRKKSCYELQPSFSNSIRASHCEERTAGMEGKPDHFPSTHYTWIGRRLGEGSPGRLELNRHVMKMYAEPLQYYFMKTSVRWLGEPEEIVAEFFKDRLARDRFFDSWQESGKPLRYWLINALNFFLKEEYRRRQRGPRMQEVADEALLIDDGPAVEQLIDQAFKVALVRGAVESACEMCTEAGLSRHWEVFVEHYYHGRPYREIQDRQGIDAARAAVMARTARRRFVAALREQLERDGVAPENIDKEIELLLEREDDAS